MTATRPIVVVHGGAGSQANQLDSAIYAQAVDEALDRGVSALAEGAAAAVVAAVAYMEASTILNAGRGAALDCAGKASLDAGFMEGAGRRFGAVAGVTRSLNPVLLAQHLAASGDYGCLLGGAAADALAVRLAASVCEPSDLVTERSRQSYRRQAGVGTRATGDTVGAVALDGHGRLAAAVSTGGTPFKVAGRIGGSPVVGAGVWADDRCGACVTTGVGEVLMRQGTARRCVELLAAGRSAPQAARAALAELSDFDDDARGPCGLIVIRRDGQVGLDHTAAQMTAGWATPGGERALDSHWRGPR